MSSGSLSVSASESESCCFPSTCACDTWLTAFCDYETVTLSYCDVETEFHLARWNDIPIEAVRPESGVFASDRIFRLSMTENTVEVGIGATITDTDGTEWIVYRVEDMRSFCVKKLWARSIATCYQLMDTIDVLEKDCSCEDCGTTVKYKRVARIRGEVLAETGTVRNQNDSEDLVYQYSVRLVRWPLKHKPNGNHRLRNSEGSFRIIRVQDRGRFAPFMMGLEKEVADCSV